MEKFLCQLSKDSTKIAESEYFAFLRGIYENRVRKEMVIAFMAILSAKTPNIRDISCFVKFVESVSPRKTIKNSSSAVNIVGTGGGITTFNISTTAAFVASAAGARVLKSGSHAYSSQSGSLDVLRALGITLGSDEATLEKMLAELGLGFIGPHLYSPFLRRIAASVWPLNLSSIGGFLNTIGPLLCPYVTAGQLTGVAERTLLDLLAGIMAEIGYGNSILVWSDVGVDEFTAVGVNHMVVLGKRIQKKRLLPHELGFRHTSWEKLLGGKPEENAAAVTSLLTGGFPEVARDTVALNAAVILLLAGQVENLEEAVEISLEAIASGAAYKKVKETISFSNDMNGHRYDYGA